MNYLREINAFYDWLETNGLDASCIALWHALMAIANKAGWPDEFAVAISVLQTKTGMSKRVVERTRNLLQQKGLVEWRQRKGNQSAIYRLITLCAKIDPQIVAQTVAQSVVQSVAQAVAQPVAIIKLNETKLSKTEREIACAKIARAYEETFGVLRGDPSQLMMLLNYVDKGMELDLVITALHKSSNAEVPLKYADSILRNQLRKGIKTAAEAIQEFGGGADFERAIDKRPRAAHGNYNGGTHSLTNGQVGRIRRPQMSSVP